MGELCTFSKGHGYNKADIRDAGTPLILYGRLYTQYESRIEEVDTFTVEQDGAILSRGNEVIVPASGETAEDIAVASSVRRSGIILGGDLNVVTPTGKLDPDYTALAITYSKAHDDLAKRAQGKSVVHVHGNDIAEVEISYPSESEQKRISSVVLNLDSLITLHRRKCQYRGLYGYLSWEQRKFSELYVINNERNENCEFGYDKTLSVATMTYNGGNGAADNSLSTYKVVRVGDIAFEGHTNKEHAYGRFVLNDAGDGLMSPRFSCLRPIVEQRYNFWKHYIPRESMMRPVLVNATKSGTMMNELVPADLMRESILVPVLYEQEAIGRFFKQLDDLITLHQ